jgi:hypothetical protein
VSIFGGSFGVVAGGIISDAIAARFDKFLQACKSCNLQMWYEPPDSTDFYKLVKVVIYRCGMNRQIRQIFTSL